MRRHIAILPPCAWALIALLLFKAAVPGMAAAAAQMRGTALVEVCTVYGVRTFTVDADGMPVDASRAQVPIPHERAATGLAEGCALTLLPAFELPLPASQQASGKPAAGSVPSRTLLCSFHPDASRAWWAGLKQGPPQS